MRLIPTLCLLASTVLASAAMADTALPTSPAKDAASPDKASRYVQTNFVANKAAYAPKLKVEKDFINAWGLATRPKGAGGHFWVTAKDVSYQYVGDVSKSSDESLRTLQVKDVPYVKLPVGGKDKFATSTVFLNSKDNFYITQKLPGVEPITAPAKFLFASDGGIVSAWTERKKEDGTFDRPADAIAVIDESSKGAQFFGLAANADYSRLYAANFGVDPRIEVFDGKFQPVDVNFENPFDDNKNGKVDPGEYAPFNVQALTTPEGDHHIFVTYAKTQACNKEGLEKKECKKGEMYVGEEDTAQPGNGRLAEFTEDGRLVAVWKDGGHLSAPWGLAFAPEHFGSLSGKLLVGNFGSGSIAAFDASSHEFVENAHNSSGKELKIDKLWGLVFGNGESLGDADALYFAAGPRDETDGIFGSLRLAVK